MPFRLDDSSRRIRKCFQNGKYFAQTITQESKQINRVVAEKPLRKSLVLNREKYDVDFPGALLLAVRELLSTCLDTALEFFAPDNSNTLLFNELHISSLNLPLS